MGLIIGLSLHRFVTYRRIRRAISLLQEGTLKLPAIAAALGFSSHSHITRTFGGVVGMTSDQYRTQFKRVMG